VARLDRQKLISEEVWSDAKGRRDPFGGAATAKEAGGERRRRRRAETQLDRRGEDRREREQA
jgi:hypothetical protein